MTADADVPTRRARFLYSPLGDVISVQLGEPGAGRLVEFDPCVDLYVDLEDAAVLLAFEIRDFRPRFPAVSQRLRAVLEGDLLAGLDDLYRRVVTTTTVPARASIEEMTAALASQVREERSVAPASPELRRTRRAAVEAAWAETDLQTAVDAALPGLVDAIDEWLRLAARWDALRESAAGPETQSAARPSVLVEEKRAVAGEPLLAARPRTLSAAVGEQLRSVRLEGDVSLGHLVAGAKSLGLRWSSKQVEDIERGARSLTLEEFVLLPFVLSRVLDRMPVELTGLLRSVPNGVDVSPLVQLSSRDVIAVLGGAAADVQPLIREPVVADYAQLPPGEPHDPLERERAWLASLPALAVLRQDVRRVRDRLKDKPPATAEGLAILRRAVQAYRKEMPGGRGRQARPAQHFRDGLGRFEQGLRLWATTPTEALAALDELKDGLAHWQLSLSEVEERLTR